MNPAAGLQNSLWWAVTVLTGVTAAKFLVSGLARIYKAFFVFLSFQIVRVLVARLVTGKRDYYYFYVTTEAVTLFLYVWMIFELYSLIFEEFKGIQSLSKWILLGSFAAATLLSILSLIPDLQAKAKAVRGITALDYLLISERGVVSALVLLILLMSVFLSWYPITLKRNLVIHTIVFSIYFVTKASIHLYHNLSGKNVDQQLNMGVSLVAILCLACWTFGLRGVGEVSQVKVGQRWDSDEEERLIGQLRGINAALARSARE